MSIFNLQNTAISDNTISYSYPSSVTNINTNAPVLPESRTIIRYDREILINSANRKTCLVGDLAGAQAGHTLLVYQLGGGLVNGFNRELCSFLSGLLAHVNRGQRSASTRLFASLSVMSECMNCEDINNLSYKKTVYQCQLIKSEIFFNMKKG